MVRRVIKTIYHGPDIGTNASFVHDDRPMWVILAEMAADYPHAQRLSIEIDPIGQSVEHGGQSAGASR